MTETFGQYTTLTEIHKMFINMYFSVKFNIFIQSLVLKTAECDRIAQIGEHNAALHSWTQFLTPGVFPICCIIIEYLKISFKWLSNPDWKTNFTGNLSYLYICKPICNSKTQSIKLVISRSDQIFWQSFTWFFSTPAMQFVKCTWRFCSQILTKICMIFLLDPGEWVL